MDGAQRGQVARAVNWDPLTVAARRQLLDALEALEAHREALVLVGSQAIYLHTGASDVAIATTTKDSDLVVIPSLLVTDPTLDSALVTAGFGIDPRSGQPAEQNRCDSDPLSPARRVRARDQHGEQC
jgi:hypothetical protein